MDLTQQKLSKAEWLNVEVMVPPSEKEILNIIIDGYENVNIRRNNTQSIVSVMKLDSAISGINEHLFNVYFRPTIEKFKATYDNIIGDYTFHPDLNIKRSKKLKKGETVRIELMDKKMEVIKDKIFEYILLNYCSQILTSMRSGSTQYAFYLYTMIQVKRASIKDINPYITHFTDALIEQVLPSVNMRDVLSQSSRFIEKNPDLLKYEDITLFNHQKQIFSLFKHHYGYEGDERIMRLDSSPPKLVLYTAPTGTGKTLTPIGLSQGHRIIFICAARHIGLALAKSAVSMGKRIGIAFGCETADDIRLHYFAASDYSINKRSGGIGKVDNSVGDKVEIMICDIKSYIIAMYYMMAFRPEHSDKEINKLIRPDCDLITYWDEPTISLDYDDHPLHDMIRTIWRENRVSNVVLSCATLPHQDELQQTFGDFQIRFPNATVETVTSLDCRKSISLMDRTGKSVLPHLLFEDYADLQRCVTHCERNQTLLRYFDLTEVISFIELVHDTENAVNEQFHMTNYFQEGISAITMNSLKRYYLTLLTQINADVWNNIHSNLKQKQRFKFKEQGVMRRYTDMDASKIGLQLTTQDAHTLTDGPTIFLAQNVENVGKYYVQQTKMPERTFSHLMLQIQQNTDVQAKITLAERELEHQLESKDAKDADSGPERKFDKGKTKTDKKANREVSSPEINKLNRLLTELRSQISTVKIDEVYVPNSNNHQQKWVNNRPNSSSYMPNISDTDICEIMALDVDNNKKLLLLLGIGMFVDEKVANPRYMEIMKRLAYEQNLFVILASSDYIYGTNYQFCHGFVGRDLQNMTQQKTIQAMGRIGRNNQQQEYTIRFRTDEMLHQLFHPPTVNKEANNMNRLFCE